MILHRLFKGIGRISFILTIMLAPWFYGGVLPVHQIFFYLGILISTISALMVLWTTYPVLHDRNTLLRMWILSIPMVLMVLLGFLQTCSLSDSTLKTVSPYILELREMFFPAKELIQQNLTETFLTEEDRSNVSGWGTCMTVYPKATFRFTAYMIMIVCAFFSAGLLFETYQAKKFLWLLVALNGLILALFVILTRVNHDLPFYSQYWPGAVIGPYVNRNNMAGYLCLCFGAAFFFFVLNISRLGKDDSEDRFDDVDLNDSKDGYADDEYDSEEEVYRYRLSQKNSRYYWWDRFLGVAESFNGVLIMSLLCCGFIAAAILSTLSRGGSVGMIIAVLCGCCCIMYRRSNLKYWYLLLIILLSVFYLVFWVGMGDRVINRMDSFVSSNEQEQTEIYNIGTRRDLWKSAINMAIKDYQWRGSGLGTWDLVELRENQRTKYGTQFVFAENIFVQTFVEGGLPGLCLLVFGWGAFFWIGLRILCKTKSKTDYALAVGFLVSSFGLLVASCFDFGIYLPANALLYAALCGSFVNQWKHPDDVVIQEGKTIAGQFIFFWNKRACWWNSIVLVALFVGGVWGFREIYQLYQSDKLLKQTVVSNDIAKVSMESLDLALLDLSAFADQCSGDAKIYNRMAEIYLMKYRLAVLEEWLKEDTERAAENWFPLTMPILFSEKVCKYLKGNLTVFPRRYRNNTFIKQYMPLACRELILACRSTPFFMENHFMLGTIVSLSGNYSYKELQSYIHHCADNICYISTHNPIVHYQGGLLTYMAADMMGALKYWKTSLLIDSRYQRGIWSCIRVRITQENIPNVIENLFNNHSWKEPMTFYLSISRDNLTFEEKIFRKELFNYIEKVFNLISEENRNVPYYLDHITWCRSQKPDEKCNSDYEKAIQMDPENAEILYNYGFYLYETGDLETAQSILGRAVEIEPKNSDYYNMYQKTLKRLDLRQKEMDSEETKEKRE